MHPPRPAERSFFYYAGANSFGGGVPPSVTPPRSRRGTITPSPSPIDAPLGGGRPGPPPRVGRVSVHRPPWIPSALRPQARLSSIGPPKIEREFVFYSTYLVPYNPPFHFFLSDFCSRWVLCFFVPPLGLKPPLVTTESAPPPKKTKKPLPLSRKKDSPIGGGGPFGPGGGGAWRPRSTRRILVRLGTGVFLKVAGGGHPTPPPGVHPSSWLSPRQQPLFHPSSPLLTST